MNDKRFDAFTKMFSNRLLTRREAVASGAGLAAASLVADTTTTAQNATPAESTHEADPASHGPTMLFVQTYQSGTIAPKADDPARYTLTLEQGHGQTVYFSDRPDRIAGSSPTPQFLQGLGFPEDNPPNAALVVETAPGETDVAVVELFNPLYDPISQGVTYEIELLANWQAEVDLDLTETPVDLASLPASFGSAQLFIDDCPGGDMYCWHGDKYVGLIADDEHDGFCYSWARGACLPCEPWIWSWGPLYAYWANRCNQKFSKCEGNCEPQYLCSVAFACFA